MSDARSAVTTILARDGLVKLGADDVERLAALYDEIQPELEQLRSLPDLRNSEPAVIFSTRSE